MMLYHDMVEAKHLEGAEESAFRQFLAPPADGGQDSEFADILEQMPEPCLVYIHNDYFLLSTPLRLRRL